MKSQLLFSVERIENAWLVTFGCGYSTTRTESFTEWSKLEKALKEWAFPYPNKNQPRGP